MLHATYYTYYIVLRYDVPVYSIPADSSGRPLRNCYGTALPTQFVTNIRTPPSSLFPLSVPARDKLDATCRLGPSLTIFRSLKSGVRLCPTKMHHFRRGDYIMATSGLHRLIGTALCVVDGSFRLNLFLISSSNCHAEVLDAARELATLPKACHRTSITPGQSLD